MIELFVARFMNDCVDHSGNRHEQFPSVCAARGHIFFVCDQALELGCSIALNSCDSLGPFAYIFITLNKLESEFFLEKLTLDPLVSRASKQQKKNRDAP